MELMDQQCACYHQTRSPSSSRVASLCVVLITLIVAAVGCEGCAPSAGSESGAEAGPSPGAVSPSDREAQGDGGAGVDVGTGDDAGIAALCGPETSGFGDPCGDCGVFVCDPRVDELFCYDPGPNDCGGCGEIDTREGRIGQSCGEYGCGVVVCNSDGTATECTGDHPTNVCGGCSTLLVQDVGAACSSCGTGVQTCARDQNSVVCFRGRSENNACGSCEPCILQHAYMDERLGGGYLRTGTLALFEDAGNGARQLVLYPLVEGPGANALVLSYFLLANSDDPQFVSPLGGCFSEFDCPFDYDCVSTLGICVEGQWISTPFAAQISPLEQGADPVRAYSTSGLSPGSFTHLVLYDWFLERVVSAGEIQPGPPAGGVNDPAPFGAGLNGADETATDDAGAPDGG